MIRDTFPLRCNWRTHPRPASQRESAEAADLLLYSATVDDPFIDLRYKNVRWFDPTPSRFLEIPFFRSSEANLYASCGDVPANPINPLGT